MSKGKKFDAAQKHFIEKELKYQKQIAFYKEMFGQYNTQITELKIENEKLSPENAQMKEWVERLLQYTELTKSDIKQACEKDKAMKSMIDLFGVMQKYL